MKIEQLVPKQEFEFEGVNLKSVEGWGCSRCFFHNKPCFTIPCNQSERFPKQKHDLIFIKTDKQNE